MVNDNEIKKITEYENILNKEKELIENLNKAIDEYTEYEKHYQKLKKYYNSKEYFDDLEKEEKGMYPEELPRGIFSEDAIFDLFGEKQNLGFKMAEEGIKTLKNY